MTEPTPHDIPAPLRRTWPQRLAVVAVVMASIASFAVAGVIWFAQQQLEDRNLTAIDSGETAAAAGGFGPLEVTTLEVESGDEPGITVDEAAAEEAPVETFPPAEPAARNILITGADNNSCIDPDSPYAGAFGDRSGFGERSDTIMMWRVNPATSQVAVLSFPRDLWVSIDGRSSRNRINTAYERDQPQRLINTIAQNFGILTDHYIQVDFCAFKTLVDALDGVSVPFERPVRDVNTGLNVTITEPACFEFDGDHALAYVRSRKLQEFVDGEWKTDGLSDLSRISRQQDFIRRVIDEAIANAFSPSVIRGLLETSDQYVVTDTELTVDKILQLAGVLSGIDPAQITTYQIQASNKIIGGAAVLVPRLDGDNMQAVLAVFRGEATLASRPDEANLDDPVESTVPQTTVPVTTQPDSATPTPQTSAPPSTIEPVPFETLPTVDPESDVVGVVPDSSISCS